jgi:redox-sensing transcriptional repressor
LFNNSGKLYVNISYRGGRAMDGKVIPEIVVGRLPVYLLALQHMLEDGRQFTSSQELGERLGISAAQIRKDLSQFGEFGKQGTGYNIVFLSSQLRRILHLNKVWDVALIGAGDIGHAVAGYQGFRHRGFRVTMIFDKDPQKIGKTVNEYVISDIAEMPQKIQVSGIKVAMIAVPASEAQSVAEQLVEAGVKAILNYAPITLNLPPEVHVEYIDPLIHLQRMAYYLEAETTE